LGRSLQEIIIESRKTTIKKMTSPENSRLDRIEALLETIAKRTDSNAKSIEALSSERFDAERRLDRDRARLYQSMADLASAQASFYTRLEENDRRQNEMVQILKLLTERLTSNQ
jgi:hypothetical protein